MRVQRLEGTAASLIWQGGDLVDVAGGGGRWTADGTRIPPERSWTLDEIQGACWLDADRLAMASGRELGVWSMKRANWVHRSAIKSQLGTLMAYQNLVVARYEHPRLIDPATGQVLAEWPQVRSGVKTLSFDNEPGPVTALHSDSGRLAVAQPDHVAVIHLPCFVTSARPR